MRSANAATPQSKSEYIAQRRKGRKEKNDSELGALGVLARKFSASYGPLAICASGKKFQA
jgi:hypothetical protein